MYPRIILLTSFILLPATTFAANTNSPQSQSKKKQTTAEADLKQFIQLLLKKGRDWTLFNDRLGPIFGYTQNGVDSKALAISGNPTRMSNIVLESDGKDKKPTCLILLTDMDFPDQLKVKNWVFRFSLDGKLEKVVSGVGQNDKDGNPVVGSEEDTLQDVNDPDVQDRARTELKFWLKTATAMIKQDSESAKRATAAAASSDLKSQETSPQSAPDTSH